MRSVDWGSAKTSRFHLLTLELGVRFIKKIQDWILKSVRIPGGFFGSFGVPWSVRSWNDLFGKETQNPFSDFSGFKNPILDFLKETPALHVKQQLFFCSEAMGKGEISGLKTGL